MSKNLTKKCSGCRFNSQIKHSRSVDRSKAQVKCYHCDDGSNFESLQIKDNSKKIIET